MMDEQNEMAWKAHVEIWINDTNFIPGNVVRAYRLDALVGQLYAGTLKLELQQDARLDVRYASWGKDAVLMVNHYGADLFVVDLTPSKAVPDEVLSAVNMARAKGRKAAVAYYAFPDEALDVHPLIRSRLTSLAPEGHVSKTKGLRALTVLCFSILELDTNTRIFRLPG